MKNKSKRLESQIQFLIEIDKVKHIFRKTKVFDGSRFENDAEHAWHLAVMALILGEYANEHIDIAKVIKMVLVHDVVEIDAGDTIVYDTKKRASAWEEENKAAERIFGILPDDQKGELIALWKEFEEMKTPEAKFAAAIDRFEPILQNHLTEYYTWKAHGIAYSQLQDVNHHIRDGSEAIWRLTQKIFNEAKELGAIKESAAQD